MKLDRTLLLVALSVCVMIAAAQDSGEGSDGLQLEDDLRRKLEDPPAATSGSADGTSSSVDDTSSGSQDHDDDDDDDEEEGPSTRSRYLRGPSRYLRTMDDALGDEEVEFDSMEDWLESIYGDDEESLSDDGD